MKLIRELQIRILRMYHPKAMNEWRGSRSLVTKAPPTCACWCHLFPRSAYSALNEIIVTAVRTCRAMRIDIPNHLPEVRMRVRGCLAFTPSMRFDRPNETFSRCRYDNDARQRTTLSVYGAKILVNAVCLSIYEEIFFRDTKMLCRSDSKRKHLLREIYFIKHWIIIHELERI